MLFVKKDSSSYPVTEMARREKAPPSSSKPISVPSHQSDFRMRKNAKTKYEEHVDSY